MTENIKHFWFPAKSFGLGWGFPIRWQGWCVLLSYIAITFFHSTLNPPSVGLITWLIYFIPTTLAFIAIVWLKGERPLKWRFGRKSSSQE